MAIDWSFISKKEGGQYLTGYIPKNKAGAAIMNSGVTIATGFDIGQWSVSDLTSLGLGKTLVDKLKPYAHPLRGSAAIQKLEAQAKAGNPLRIDKSEADRIDAAVKGDMARKVRRAYDRGAKAKAKTVLFDALPNDIQTAIASFMYQFGSGIYRDRFKGTPQYNFYQAITDQDWALAQKLLPTCAGPLDRRQGEVRLIQRGQGLVLPTSSSVSTAPGRVTGAPVRMVPF